MALGNLGLSFAPFADDEAIRKKRRAGMPVQEFVLDLNRTRQQEAPAWTETDRTIGGYIHWGGAETATGNRGRLFSWRN